MYRVEVALTWVTTAGVKDAQALLSLRLSLRLTAGPTTLGALGQVEGAVEKKVWNVFTWGIAVGAAGGCAGGSSNCGGAVEVAVECAGGAEPVARWWDSEGWVEAATVPCGVACVT